ncbi:hypothetical protein [Homoserinimonas sp. A520]
MRSALPLAAVTIAVAMLLSGCVPQDPEITPPPEPTTEPIFASDEEALAAATDAYAAYLAMSDLIAQEGGANPERIQSVAVRDALADAVEGYAVFQENGYRSSGNSQIRSVEFQYYSQAQSEITDIAAVYACLDVTNVDVVDSSGVSVVESSRPDVQLFEVTFDVLTLEPPELIVASRDPWSGDNSCDQSR